MTYPGRRRRRFFEWRVVLVLAIALLMVGVAAVLGRTLTWTDTYASPAGSCTTTQSHVTTMTPGQRTTVTMHCPVTWTAAGESHTGTLNLGSKDQPGPDGRYHVVVNGDEVQTAGTRTVALAVGAAGLLLILAITVAQILIIRHQTRNGTIVDT